MLRVGYEPVEKGTPHGRDKPRNVPGAYDDHLESAVRGVAGVRKSQVELQTCNVHDKNGDTFGMDGLAVDIKGEARDRRSQVLQGSDEVCGDAERRFQAVGSLHDGCIESGSRRYDEALSSPLGSVGELAKIDVSDASLKSDTSEFFRIRRHAHVEREHVRCSRRICEYRDAGVGQCVADRRDRSVATRSDDTIVVLDIAQDGLERIATAEMPDGDLGLVLNKCPDIFVYAGIALSGLQIDDQQDAHHGPPLFDVASRMFARRHHMMPIRYCVDGGFASTDGRRHVYVSNSDALHELVSLVRGAEFVAIDTEFMRERTYYAKLCLVQLATDDVEAIVDPLTIEDLTPLLDALADVRMTKVLHAGQQDLEIICRISGTVPAPIFDTQVAATLAGFPTQVGYGALVNDIAGVKLDKSDTFTDWARRPLSSTQIEYALNDVRYLPTVYRELRSRLDSEGRLSWLEPEFDRMADPATYEVVPEEQFRRIKRVSSLKARQLGVLMKLTAWREREAQRRDIPRKWVLGDESLIEIARRAPEDRESLAAIRGVADKLGKALYPSVLQAVADGMAIPRDELPTLERKRRKPLDVDGAVDLMAALVRLRAKEHGVATPLLASRSELEQLAGGEREDTPLLEGWRRSIVGDELLRLLDGELTLRLDEGRLVIDDCCIRSEQDDLATGGRP
jgi:ribonuclease D